MILAFTGTQIAAVLRSAADQYLWNPSRHGAFFAAKEPFRTFGAPFEAVPDHAVGLVNVERDLSNAASQWLAELGMPAEQDHEEFERGIVRQSARYAWLMFAADLAEEESLIDA